MSAERQVLGPLVETLGSVNTFILMKQSPWFTNKEISYETVCKTVRLSATTKGGEQFTLVPSFRTDFKFSDIAPKV
jgi:hypothetical protein